MNTFESISETLDQARDALLQSLELLENPGLHRERLLSLFKQTRQAQYLAELATITTLRELQAADGFDPHSRSSFSNVLHVGKFGRSELRNATKLADELFEHRPSLECLEPTPARLPHVAKGMHKAAFGADSALEISRCMDRIPEGTPAATVAWVEKSMAGFAETLAPEDLRKAGLKILQGLNAENPPSDSDRQRQRNASLSNQGADLMSDLKVRATPELDALLRRLFADYAGPGDLLPEEEKEGDTRTAGQRRYDALVAAIKHAVNPSGPMRPTRGCSTVVATMTLEQLQAAAGIVPTDVGTLLPIADLIRLGADRNAFLAILDAGTGSLIELGKSKRAADLYAYLGLFAAQGGDATPGSDLPAAMCEIHHVHAWRLGGRSTGRNMMFLGHQTHRRVDDLRKNTRKWWTYCTETGQLILRPPDSVDPERRPTVNFNPAKWLIPGQMVRFGLHEPDTVPPFQKPVCPNCRETVM